MKGTHIDNNRIRSCGRLARGFALLAACAAFSSRASAGEIVYSAKPESEPIVVENGDTAKTQDYKLFRDDLWACWRFDDAENLLADSSGNGHDLVAAGGSFEALSAAADKVRGDSAAGFAQPESYLSVGTVPECLRGGSPFTISMWVRETDQIQTSGSSTVGGYLYVGNSSTSHSSDYATNCLAIQKLSVRQFYVGIPAVNNGTYRNVLNLGEGNENQGKWTHLALSYSPAEGATYYIFCQGVTQNVTKAGYRLAPEFVDSIWFGLSRYNASSRWLCKSAGTAETAIDEIFVFTNALSKTEIDFVREHSQPTEFSAKWQVEADGTLDILGVEPQEVNGYGTLVAPDGITLAPQSESYFGGTIESAFLAIDAASSSVTQTLAGAASYSGGTAVETGTLVVRPEPIVPAALKNGLVGFWTFDNPLNAGHDLSGCGNDMLVNANLGYAAAPNDGGGKAIDFNQGGTENRWLAKTKTAPFDPNGETPAHTNGWPLTMAVWTQTRVPFNAPSKAGLAAFEGRCAFGIGYPGSNEAYARRLGFGGRNNVGTGYWDADIDDAIGTALVTNAVHCYVLTFDPVESMMVFYFDGVQRKSANYTYILRNEQPQWPGSGNFLIGAGYQSGANQVYYNGLVDQAMLWNRPLSPEEVASVHAFGLHAAPVSATGAIPSSTELDIAQGATAVFENANETISGLAGSGTLSVSASAKLTITDTFSATAAASGGGTIALGSDLTFVSPSEGEGVKEFLTAPAGMIQMPASTANWTISGVGISNPSVSFRLRNNGDGTETLICRIGTAATVLSIR